MPSKLAKICYVRIANLKDMHQRHAKEVTQGAHLSIRRYNHIVLYCTVNDVALWERYVANVCFYATSPY